MARTADFLIQAGHEGRTSGATGASGPIANEIDWTPRIANRATEKLRAAGYSVLRVKADDWDDTETAKVKIACSIHFDGASPACNSGTSFGYNDSTDKPAVDILRAAYLPYVPDFVNRMSDNFTANLSGYGDFKDWITSVSEFVWEVCEISCRSQAEWAQPRLDWFGDVLAHALDAAVGGTSVQHPGPFDIADPNEDISIMGLADVTVGQMQAWANLRGAHQDFIDLAPVFFQEGVDLGVKPGIGYALSYKETNGGKFTGVVPRSYNNWCGLKVNDTSVFTDSDWEPTAHQQFPDDRTGIRALFEHLHLYAAGPVPAPVDPRHFPWLAGRAPTVEDPDLWGNGPTYGPSVHNDYLKGLYATPAPPESPPLPGIPPPDPMLERVRGHLLNAGDEIEAALDLLT